MTDKLGAAPNATTTPCRAATMAVADAALLHHPSQASVAHQPSTPAASGVVKWFDEERGYGFVLMDSGHDAFLHVSTLGRLGVAAVQRGDRLVCQLGMGTRGLQVEAVQHHETVASCIGRVRFFDAVRGYGFVCADGLSRDVFVGTKLLRRLGLSPLRAGQAVRFTAKEGATGLVAESLSFL